MEGKKFSFEGLDVYKAARELVRDIYRLQHKFPKYEIYALGDQIRRSFKEKSHFIEIAYGSLMEAFSQLQIAQDLGYLSQDDIDNIRPHFINVAKMLSGLKNYFDNNQPQ